jgi:hypothetical protein
MFVNFGDVDEASDSFHDFTETPVTLAVVGNQHFNALRQRFMAFRKAFEAFVNCHVFFQYSGRGPIGTA